MDESRESLNTEELSGAEPPREVVLRYAPQPREVTSYYIRPEPLPGARRDAAAAPEAAAPEDKPAAPAARAPKRRGWLWFLLGAAAVPLLGCVLAVVLYFTGRLDPLFDYYDYYDYYDYRGDRGYDYGERATHARETTIPRYPNGDGTRLRFSETHGDALSVQEIYARVNPSTVTVAALVSSSRATIGTGVIFTPDGYILTNAHVVSGGSECFVALDTGARLTARLVGMDEEKDLAVIKVDGRNDLPAAEFGDSDALTVGDAVYAIGNPLGVELRGTLTDGIVSAINRDVDVDGVTMTLIQTNAALNSGNSGGPLINVYGQVVGINTMKMGSRSSVSVEGLGFAIPISSTAYMVDNLIAYGEVRGEPVIGVMVRGGELPDGEPCVEIAKVTPGGPADAAGVEPDDLIVGADGEAVGSVSDLLRIRRRFGAGETLRLTIRRDGAVFDADVVLGEAT